MRKETGGSDSSCTAVKNREWMRPGAKNALVDFGCSQNTCLNTVSIIDVHVHIAIGSTGSSLKSQKKETSTWFHHLMLLDVSWVARALH